MKIPIKKYVMDESLTWEERYKKLEAHHKEETEWLIGEIKRLKEATGTGEWAFPCSQCEATVDCDHRNKDTLPSW